DLYGETHVLLNSLAPSVTFHLNTDLIRLDITAQPDRVASTSFSVTPDRPPGLQYPRSFSAILNYAAHWQNDVSGAAVATEFGVSAAKGVFLTGVLRTADGRYVRGLSTLTVDQRANRRRWV